MSVYVSVFMSVNVNVSECVCWCVCLLAYISVCVRETEIGQHLCLIARMRVFI